MDGGWCAGYSSVSTRANRASATDIDTMAFRGSGAIKPGTEVSIFNVHLAVALSPVVKSQ